MSALEFLGDAILGAIVCEVLFLQYPDYLEGDLTRIKSVVVSRTTCAKISKSLGLDGFLVMGKGMGSQEETPSSVLADVFESLIGAIYLDGGMEAAKRFILRHVEAEIASTADGTIGVNHKSNLQQVAQRQFGETPTYLLLDEKGPDHSKCFKIVRPDRPPALRPRLGPQQERRRATRRHERPQPTGGEPIPFASD